MQGGTGWRLPSLSRTTRRNHSKNRIQGRAATNKAGSSKGRVRGVTAAGPTRLCPLCLRSPLVVHLVRASRGESESTGYVWEDAWTMIERQQQPPQGKGRILSTGERALLHFLRRIGTGHFGFPCAAAPICSFLPTLGWISLLAASNAWRIAIQSWTM